MDEARIHAGEVWAMLTTRLIGTEKFYLKVGRLLYKRGADVGLRPDGLVVKSDAEKIEAERILSENIPSEHAHKRKVINPSLGELVAAMGQIDEFRNIRAQFITQRLTEGASMKQATEEEKQLTELLETPEVKKSYKELKDTNKKLISIAEKIEKLGQTKNLEKHKLNTFLNNTQHDIEINSLKTEYNKVARECLVQLTKFRLSVQDWSNTHPEYAKVAEWLLTGAKYGATYVAVAGIVTACASAAPISIPVAVAGAGIAYTKYELKKYLLKKIVEYATKQGTTLKERLEFEKTINWIIDKFEGVRNTKTVLSTATNVKTFLKQKPIKTYIPKIDRSIEIAHILREASKGYYKTHKQRLLDDVLNVFAHE